MCNKYCKRFILDKNLTFNKNISLIRYRGRSVLKTVPVCAISQISSKTGNAGVSNPSMNRFSSQINSLEFASI